VNAIGKEAMYVERNGDSENNMQDRRAKAS
jgi:hypothetical protein